VDGRRYEVEHVKLWPEAKHWFRWIIHNVHSEEENEANQASEWEEDLDAHPVDKLADEEQENNIYDAPSDSLNLVHIHDLVHASNRALVWIVEAAQPAHHVDLKNNHWPGQNS